MRLWRLLRRKWSYHRSCRMLGFNESRDVAYVCQLRRWHSGLHEDGDASWASEFDRAVSS